MQGGCLATSSMELGAGKPNFHLRHPCSKVRVPRGNTHDLSHGHRQLIEQRRTVPAASCNLQLKLVLASKPRSRIRQLIARE